MTQKIFGWSSFSPYDQPLASEAEQDDSRLKAMYEAFEVSGPDLPTLDQILIAEYTYESYSGSVFVLFEKDGRIYEVNGDHCSCNGIEGQWSPEETTWEALYMRRFYCQPEAEAFFKRRTVDGQVVTKVRALPSGQDDDDDEDVHPAYLPIDWGDEDY